LPNGWGDRALRLTDFEALVRRQAAEIPAEFLDGIAEVVVSPLTQPHPDRDEVWTLGECIPLPGDDGDPRHLQSRIVLYHGSFQALAQGTEAFDWVEETWETLTHEVRHHVEWKARSPDLEAFDLAAESNFARQDGEPFDPVFYRDGLRQPDGSFRVDDDCFLERVVEVAPSTVPVRWAAHDYRVSVPVEATIPAFLVIEGVKQPPLGQLVLVLQRRSSWRELFRRPAVFQAEVEANPLVR
jgi:predicted Zn-dependent protease with MMP-like domain